MPGRPFFVPIDTTREWCGSFYLAKRFNADGVDFAHLLDLYGDLQMSRETLEAVAEYVAMEDNGGVPIEVIYRADAGEDNPITPIRQRLRSGRCQVIDYFRIPLYCFNSANGKQDHLGYVIPFLTIMLYTSDAKFWNPLTGESILTHQFLYNSQVKIIDGTMPSLIWRHYPDLLQGAPTNFEICGGGDPDASAQGHRIGEQNLVFLCAQSLAEGALQMKVRKASVVYHEVNHPVGVHLSNNWTHAQIEGHAKCCNSREGDIGMVSVYGAQVYYQFYLSTHARLSCQQRKTIFWSAKKNMRCKFCKEWCDDNWGPMPPMVFYLWTLGQLPAPTSVSHELENSPPQCVGDSLIARDQPCD